MKVLFVLNSGFDTPGPSNHLLEAIIEKLLIEGHKVHIIQKYSFGKNHIIPKSISKYSNLTSDSCQVKLTGKTNFIKRYLRDIKYALSCIKYYKKHKNTDVIFLQSCNTAFFQNLFLKLTIRKPIVYNVQDIFPVNASLIGLIKKDSLVYRALRMLQKGAYKLSDKIITISEDMKETIVNENIPANKIDVIHNWSYSDEIIEIQDEQNKFLIDNKIETDDFKVVYAGNIGMLQNVDVIMNAAKLLKDKSDIKFYIIGDGALKKKYINFTKINDLDNVIFYPFQPSDLAPHIYSMADINIIPLEKGVINTALPSKTAICLSSGNPLIACIDKNSKFAKTLRSLDKCSVVNSDDAKGLAESIKEYYNNPSPGKSIDQRNLFKERFSKSENVNKYVESIEKTVNINRD